MNNKIIITAVAVIVISGSFYAGTKYASAQRGGSAMRANFTRGTQVGQFGDAVGRGMKMGGAIIGGEVMSKDIQSVTVKLNDGGSKIVFLSSSTPIIKTAPGTIEDVVIGGQVSVTGDQNPDGSVTAKSVQLRTNSPAIK